MAAPRTVAPSSTSRDVMIYCEVEANTFPIIVKDFFICILPTFSRALFVIALLHMGFKFYDYMPSAITHASGIPFYDSA